jgi:hypothetical protein
MSKERSTGNVIDGKKKINGNIKYVRFEIFTAVTMKNAVFWDVALCRSCVNRRFGGMYRLHLQGRKIREQVAAHTGSLLTDFSTLKMEVIRSSKTSVHTRSTRRHIPEDSILHKIYYFSQIYQKHTTSAIRVHMEILLMCAPA